MQVLERQLAGAGFVVVHRASGKLANGQAAPVSLGRPLMGGQQYAVAAIGHPGSQQRPHCTGLKLVLSDGQGHTFVKNEATDPRASVVMATPTTTRTHNASIHMTCNGGPCKWALIVVRRAAAAPPPAATPIPASTSPTAQLNQLGVQWDANTGNWVFLVNGSLRHARGMQAELRIEFEFFDPDNRRWVIGPGLAGEDANARRRYAQHRDARGNVVIRHSLQITQDPLAVGPLHLRIPHIAFNINDDPDGSVHNARAKAVIIVGGKQLAQSSLAPFRLTW